MAQKKSLYEILEVPGNASYPEISAAYDRLRQSLESRQSEMTREDYTMQLRLLKVAQSTLSSPQTRDGYDAQLAVAAEPAKPGRSLANISQGDGRSVAEIRAEAILMRADALAMRADALGLKADLSLGPSRGRDDSAISQLASAGFSGLKRVLLVLGTLAAMGMVIKILFLVAIARNPNGVVVVPGPVSEKVYLQEYYQTYGVRPASRAEADLMDAERRKNEEAKRALEKEEERKQAIARDQERFEEKARSRGEQVSTELQYAEERARQAKLQDDQRKEYEARNASEAERRRVEDERRRDEAERAKWERVLTRPGGY